MNSNSQKEYLEIVEELRKASVSLNCRFPSKSFWNRVDAILSDSVTPQEYKDEINKLREDING